MLLRKCWIDVGKSYRYLATSRAPSSSTVSPDETLHFSRLAREWMDEDGPMKALHSFNRIRVPWIVEELQKESVGPNSSITAPLRGLKLLDVGCGGGILSLPLARLGAEVDGIDCVKESIETGRLVADATLNKSSRQRLRLEVDSVENWANKNSEKYDGVIASEIIEHVADPSLFVQSCARLVKPKAPLFFSTINRTVLSQLVAITVAETLRFIPPGTHQWNKFISPDEIARLLFDSHCTVAYTRGLLYDPLVNEWGWFGCEQVNYALLARKA